MSLEAWGTLPRSTAVARRFRFTMGREAATLEAEMSRVMTAAVLNFIVKSIQFE